MANLPVIAITKGIFKNDPNGAILDTEMAALGTLLNSLSPTGPQAPLYKITQEKLNAKCLETVMYYISTGRLNAYSILANLAQ